MNVWAKYPDGVEVSENAFQILAAYAPYGSLDVFASDQHSSYLRLSESFLEHIGQRRKATDDDVTKVCRLFAGALGGSSTAVLFNHLAYTSPGFRELLGQNTLLIGRVEDTNTEPMDHGHGQLARLAIEPEDASRYVDGFKTLVKLNPEHRESWDRNRRWLEDVYSRCRELGKPLFNETLLFQKPGESKKRFAERLPEDLVRVARDFSPFGDFYKTQVPFLWIEEDGRAVRATAPEKIRACAEEMAEASPRPMLLLSAAVDFPQYAAQYALASDMVAGPMCGRAYFKEAFTAQETTDWVSLGESFRRIALPRIGQIRYLASVVSRKWWSRYQWISDEARKLIHMDSDIQAGGVKADFGY